MAATVAPISQRDASLHSQANDEQILPAPSYSSSSMASHSSGSSLSNYHRYLGPYELQETLGMGEFGKVKLGRHTQTNQKVAIKLIDKNYVETSKIRDKVDREIEILKMLWHPSIIKLFDVVETEKYIGIVLEYAPGGELFEYIVNRQYLDEPTAQHLFAQLISSVHYMHSKSIVHRDLKLENLLMLDDEHIVITDFGFANHYADTRLLATCCGSPCYAAPELLEGASYVGPAVDVWSCGVILYAMLCGFLPFEEHQNIQQLYQDIVHDPITFPNHVSADAQDLVLQMLVPDPAKRCTLETVMNHPWLAGHRALLQRPEAELELLAKQATIPPLPITDRRERVNQPVTLVDPQHNTNKPNDPTVFGNDTPTEQVAVSNENEQATQWQADHPPQSLSRQEEDSSPKESEPNHLKLSERDDHAFFEMLQRRQPTQNAPDRRRFTWFSSIRSRKRQSVTSQRRHSDDRTNVVLAWLKSRAHKLNGAGKAPCSRVHQEALLVNTKHTEQRMLTCVLQASAALGLRVENQGSGTLLCTRTEEVASVFGHPSIDDQREVTLTVKVCRLTQDSFMVDVRRIDGQKSAYAFVSDKLLNVLEIAMQS